MCVSVLTVHICVPHAWSTHRVQKMVSDTLGLEFQTAVCHYGGAGNLTQDFWESNQCS